MTCTLLGPEGPGSALLYEQGGYWDFRTLSCFPLGERGGYRPYFENYTVDASILDSDSSGSGSQRSNVSRDRGIDHWSISAAGVSRLLAIDSYSCGQVSKSKRWMPWHLEPKKDVVICDKPRGADKRALIRGSPNGETPPGVAIRPGDSRLNI